MTFNHSQITEFFQTAHKFGSLFILSDKDNQKRIVAEIKQINDGLNQVSFIPLSEEDEFEYKNEDFLQFINEANNISFKAEVVAIHSKKWVTVTYPPEIKVVNLREHKRFNIPDEHLSGSSKVNSFGEQGVKRLMGHDCKVIEISEFGASMEIKASGLDGYYKGDHVELMITEKFPFLTQLRGKVVHKTIANMMDRDARIYRLGVRFSKKINLDPLSLS